MSVPSDVVVQREGDIQEQTHFEVLWGEQGEFSMCVKAHVGPDSLGCSIVDRVTHEAHIDQSTSIVVPVPRKLTSILYLNLMLAFAWTSAVEWTFTTIRWKSNPMTRVIVNSDALNATIIFEDSEEVDSARWVTQIGDLIGPETDMDDDY